MTPKPLPEQVSLQCNVRSGPPQVATFVAHLGQVLLQESRVNVRNRDRLRGCNTQCSGIRRQPSVCSCVCVCCCVYPCCVCCCVYPCAMLSCFVPAPSTQRMNRARPHLNRHHINHAVALHVSEAASHKEFVGLRGNTNARSSARSGRHGHTVSCASSRMDPSVRKRPFVNWKWLGYPPLCVRLAARGVDRLEWLEWCLPVICSFHFAKELPKAQLTRMNFFVISLCWLPRCLRGVRAAVRPLPCRASIAAWAVATGPALYQHTSL